MTTSELTQGEPLDTKLERLVREWGRESALSPRELDHLVRLVAHGDDAAVAAGNLDVSPETVRAARKRIYRKMDVDSGLKVCAEFAAHLAARS